MVKAVLSTWVPKRTPTWSDIFIAVLASITALLDLFTESGTWAWPWVVVGFILWMIGSGPVAKTSTGQHIGDWFRKIGGAGRLLVILLIVVVVYSIIYVFDIPTNPIYNFINGMLLGIGVFVLLHIFYAGEVSGWVPN